MNPEERYFIQRCVSGEQAAWDEFVEKFTRLIYDSILRTFRLYGHSSHSGGIIDDLHHDVFVTLLDNRYHALRIFEGRNGCQLAQYIRTITVRKTVDYLRKQKPTRSLDDQSGDGDGGRGVFEEVSPPDANDPLVWHEAIRLTEVLLAELQEDERRFCQMCFREGREPEEVAKRFGISVENVYVRKSRLIKKLKQIAQEKGVV
jgi:RNA polymerase sigma factor (sigma-70 family)